MSSFTPNLSLPYPALTDAPNVPADIAALANAVDSTLGTPLIVGPGSSTNLVTGGANRTTQPLFLYSASANITITSGSAWTFTTSGTVFHGCGNFHVTPGNSTNSLGFLSAVLANCNISGGNLTLEGAAFNTGDVRIGTGDVITLHVTAVGW